MVEANFSTMIDTIVRKLDQTVVLKENVTQPSFDDKEDLIILKFKTKAGDQTVWIYHKYYEYNGIWYLSQKVMISFYR